jgi:hypothetical protein
MNEEDEAFNDIERRSKVKQTLIVHKSKEAMLIAEVAVLTEMVRVLSDRIAQMDAEKTLQALHDENKRLGLYDPNGT